MVTRYTSARLAICATLLLAPAAAPAQAVGLRPTTQPGRTSRSDDAATSLAEIRAALAAGRAAEAENAATAAVQRFPDSPDLHLALADAALALNRPALALARVQQGLALRPPPHLQAELNFRAAQAWFRQGTVLGAAQVRRVPGGRAGQFNVAWLLVEARPGPEQFLCCPPDSALYQLRAALDAGLDDPAAHVLHARIWQQLGRPDVGLALLRSRSVALLADPQPALLEVFADLSLATGNIADYLRFQRRRAERDQANASDILSTAYLTAADRHSERGDEALCLCCLRRAQRLRPDDPDLLLRLADMAWGAGRSTEARTLYHRLLELRPAHPQRARLLERLALPDESAPDAQTRGHASAAPTNVFSARVSVE